MKAWKQIILLFIFSLAWHPLSAEEPAVSIQCDSVSFAEFVNELEASSQMRVYYREEWTEDMKVTIHVTNEPVSDVLKMVLGNTDISFIIQNDKIILSKDFLIKTDYKLEVLNAYEDRGDVLPSDQLVYKPLERKAKESAEVNPEFLLHRIGNPARRNIGEEAVISGYIEDVDNGEPLVGAIVYLEELTLGAATNEYGFYSIRVPKGQMTLEFRFVGQKTTRRSVQLFSDGLLNVEMEEDIVSLREVTISTEGQQNVRSLSMGMEKISIKQIKELPFAFGEADIIKSVVLLPGIQTVGEGASGFNVRGGSTDQNLILLDRAPLMNTSHFVGLFSAINADIMKDATLYKSSIPAKYGGRISSVFDLQTRDGNKKEFQGSGGISPIMGRILLEGPLVKDESSFILGARSSYSNWVLKQLSDEKLKRSKVFFVDVNGKLTFDLNESNSIYGSFYYSRDKFDYFDEVAYDYSNTAATLTWKNIIGSNLFSLYSLVLSNYSYSTVNKGNEVSSAELGYSVGQYKADVEYTWFPSYNHKIKFGGSSLWHTLNQGTLQPYGSESAVSPAKLENEQGLESALFFSSDYDINSNITISAGLRLSSLLVFGPSTVNQYQNPDNRTIDSVTGTTYYDKGQLIESYFNPEPRVSIRISLDPMTSVKFGYTRMAQYLHMLSNTTAISPTDTWKLSDEYLKPQVGDQLGVGFYRNFFGNSLETSLELYYRKLSNIIDYKGGAVLVMNEHLETDVMNGRGKAYGAEIMVKRTKGKVSGWISYSYSRIFHQIDSKDLYENINEGNYFPANYDKPNNLSVVGNYKLSRRVSFSSTFDYSDGRPVTFPLSGFEYRGSQRLQYSERNDFRLPSYIRWDLSMTLDGNLKAKKLAHSSFTFAIYNVTGRRNPYSVFFRTEDGIIKGYQLSVFGQPIPTLTYNFRF